MNLLLPDQPLDAEGSQQAGRVADASDSTAGGLPKSVGGGRFNRREWLQRALFWGATPAVAGIYAHYVEPFRIHYPQIDIPVRHLPTAFDGFRFAQLTDLHAGRVPMDYLARVIADVNRIKPDAVFVTGDITHHHRDYVEPMSRLLATLSMPVIVSFGNHEFGIDRREPEPNDPDLDDHVEKSLIARGMTVLRNDCKAVVRGSSRLWIVGLDDLWFGHFDPAAGFKGVAANEPVICLSHNPDTVPWIEPFKPDLILSGHTHGGQIRVPFYGPPRLNIANTQFDMGLFQLSGGSRLFVSSGIGYIKKIRFNCRPEAPVFTLRKI